MTTSGGAGLHAFVAARDDEGIMTIGPRNRHSRRNRVFWLFSYMLMIFILAMATLPVHA